MGTDRPPALPWHKWGWGLQGAHLPLPGTQGRLREGGGRGTAAVVGWDEVGTRSPGTWSPGASRAGGQGLVSPGSQEPVAHWEGHRVSQILTLQLFVCP